MECEARLRGLYQIIYSKTIYNSKTDNNSKTDDALVAVIVTLLRIGCDDHASAYRSGFLEAPAFLLSFWDSERPNSPFSPCGRRGAGGMLTEVDFLASPCVPSLVSAIRTPQLPLLPLWEKGAGGMRDNGAREYRTSLISPKNSTLESWGNEGRKRTGTQKAAHLSQ